MTGFWPVARARHERAEVARPAAAGDADADAAAAEPTSTPPWEGLMAVRRKRTRVDRTTAIKTKQAAALRHNAKLVTLSKHSRPTSSHEGRARRIKNVQRRQQGRRKPALERDIFQFLPTGLDPRTWLQSRGGSRKRRAGA